MSRQLAATPRAFLQKLEGFAFGVSDDILTLQSNSAFTLGGHLVNVQSVTVKLSFVAVTPVQVRPRCLFK